MHRVVIIGYGEMFTNLIAGSLDANCNIVGVFRREMIKYPPIIRYLKDIFNPSTDYNYIKSYNLPEISARSVNSKKFKKELIKLNPDIILVGSWSEKISKEIYNLPRIAAINAHPSLLPKYRGPNPYFWAIRNLEQKSGITFHLLDSGFDTGSILAQEEIEILPFDTGKTLKERTVIMARRVLTELLKDLGEDIIIPLQQREDKASYYSNPDNLCLDFSKSAEENYALMRACHPWCDSYFYHKYTCFKVSHRHAEIIENNTEFTEIGTVTECIPNKCCISVLCADNKILRLSNLSLYSKIDKPFTKNYIKREISAGDNLIAKF